jgi:hypothetical protein
MQKLLCFSMFHYFTGVMVIASSLASADEVQLSNGDHLNGKVISLDEKVLLLKSDVLGEVKLAREKVVSIQLGERPASVRYVPVPEFSTPPAIPPSLAPRSGAENSNLPPESKTQLPGVLPKAPAENQKPANTETSVQDVLKQLKKGGLEKSVQQVEGEFPLLAVPEVKEYFDTTLKGLITGEVSVDNLRKQALDVRKQVKELEKELGPEGVDALKPYMSILDKFIRESEPAKKP